MKIRGNTITIHQKSLPIAGGKMEGSVNMDNHSITGLPAPENSTDAVRKADLDKKLSLSGGTMTGSINMNGKSISGVKTPKIDSEAAHKKYVDDAKAAANKYTDEKHLPLTAVISTNWVGESAPYTQVVAVEGIKKEDHPHVMPIYSDVLETALAQKEAWSMVSDADTADGSITFTCFEDKPTVAINVQIEVNR
jgi:hypothetical protein